MFIFIYVFLEDWSKQKLFEDFIHQVFLLNNMLTNFFIYLRYDFSCEFYKSNHKAFSTSIGFLHSNFLSFVFWLSLLTFRFVLLLVGSDLVNDLSE